MQTIRPFQLFTLLEASPSDRVAQFVLPSRRGTGGLSMLETSLVVAASRIVGAKRIFEFGTYLGATTLNLALNAPEDCEVLTLDLGEDDAAGLEQDTADAPLTQTHLKAASQLDFAGSAASVKIRTLTGNSTRFDFSSYEGSVDFVFIDGGHDLATVRSDTENALRMVSSARPAGILWHDYGNPEYPDLTTYLDGLAMKLPMVHIGDTMLCVWLSDAAGGLGAMPMAA